ncbi:hypothetical protein LM601614_41068 [Listeria monocytogenes]|nr:hypothetical protein LM601614_41068 [Listeria monocytogenes]CUM34771.1 hypothetical protein SLCC85_40351 [Listeria monocytogenes]
MANIYIIRENLLVKVRIFPYNLISLTKKAKSMHIILKTGGKTRFLTCLHRF